MTTLRVWAVVRLDGKGGRMLASVGVITGLKIGWRGEHAAQKLCRRRI